MDNTTRADITLLVDSLQATERGNVEPQPWYRPTKDTLFPIKKADYLKAKAHADARAARELASSLLTGTSKEGDNQVSFLETLSPSSEILSPDLTKTEATLDVAGPTKTIDRDLERGESRDEKKDIQLRNRESIERMVMAIEDPEERRLTALAYLS